MPDMSAQGVGWRALWVGLYARHIGSKCRPAKPAMPAINADPLAGGFGLAEYVIHPEVGDMLLDTVL